MAKEWNAEEFRSYLQAHHTEYEPVFYSGTTYDEFHDENVFAWKVAEWYASQHSECKTVETLVKEAGFNDLNEDQMNKASEIYAKESSGAPHYFFGDEIDSNSTWAKHECDKVMKNIKINDEGIRFNLIPEQAGGERSYTCNKNSLPSGS
ncbi:MAG: hypothetical protein FWH37_00820 [Candidatus Bathyarchaeota archaeon]|nr:hypothetical protein [Candidatus Termiticorpusculum sp.]